MIFSASGYRQGLFFKDLEKHHRNRKKGFHDNLCNGNQVCTDLGIN